MVMARSGGRCEEERERGRMLGRQASLGRTRRRGDWMREGRVEAVVLDGKE